MTTTTLGDVKIAIENTSSESLDAIAINSMSNVQLLELIVALGGASLILFVLFVLPIWLFLHYRSRTKHLAPPPVVRPVQPAAYEDLAELARLAERIEHRLDAVETLMDAENPRWRS